MKSITRKANIDIVTSSKRDWNEAAVVMQINFTECCLKVMHYKELMNHKDWKKYWW